MILGSSFRGCNHPHQATGLPVCGIVQGCEVTKEYSIGMAGDMGIKGCHSFAAFLYHGLELFRAFVISVLFSLVPDCRNHN